VQPRKELPGFGYPDRAPRLKIQRSTPSASTCMTPACSTAQARSWTAGRVKLRDRAHQGVAVAESAAGSAQRIPARAPVGVSIEEVSRGRCPSLRSCLQPACSGSSRRALPIALWSATALFAGAHIAQSPALRLTRLAAELCDGSSSAHPHRDAFCGHGPQWRRNRHGTSPRLGKRDRDPRRVRSMLRILIWVRTAALAVIGARSKLPVESGPR